MGTISAPILMELVIKPFNSEHCEIIQRQIFMVSLNVFSGFDPKQEHVQVIEGRPYDIIIGEVSYERAGTYKCDYISGASVLSTEAELMSMGEY